MGKEIPIDEDLEMSPEKIEELTRRLEGEKIDDKIDDAWHKFHGTKPEEEDVKKFSGGGVVRGTGAQIRGLTFRGVF
tara:strand:+ start:89 stop:319 length:231 start_codon:yes stop_codon:yes gene_type:complete